MGSRDLSTVAGRAVGCWLCLAVVLLACGGAGGQKAGRAEGGGECFALVEYVALIGDVRTANLSDFFRGELRVQEIDAEEEIVNGSIKLAWTFSAGETLKGRSSINADRTKFGYSSETVDEQRITLWWNDSAGFSDGSLSTVRFSGEKGNSAPADAGFTNYTLAAPNNVALNDYQCVPIEHEDELVAISKEEVNRGDLVLLYMPLEFTNFRSSDGFGIPSTTFAFRIINVGSRVIDLKHVRLEYWFHGDDRSLVTNAKEMPFKGDCRASTANCSLTVTKIRPGQRGVQGAQFKMEISFLEGAGILPTNESSLSTEQNVSTAPPLLEAIVNITSTKLFGQMNSTRDFSYLETEIDDDKSLLADIPDLVNRVYAKNKRMPVYVKGKRVWGSSPEAGEEKVEADGLECEVVNVNTARCGLRKQYCCKTELKVAPPPPPVGILNGTLPETPEGSSTDSPIVPLIGGVVGGLVGLVAIACCWRSKKRRQRQKLHIANLEKMAREQEPYKQIKHSARPESPALSEDNLDIDGLDEELGIDTREGESEPLIAAKYHTVPSISGADSSFLMEMKERRESTDVEARDIKSWNGYMHWQWEGFEMSFATECQQVRRTTTGAANMGPQGVLTQNFQNLSAVNFDVDYKTEIEPFLGEKLGEGGFGKVFQATWRHVKVAVKVMKIDNDSMQQTLEDEIKLTSRFHHPNIVKVLAACFRDKENICLIMELVENGSLSQRIHNRNKRKLEYMEVLKLGHDIAQALAYLHPTVIHRDLKPQNVLLDLKGRAKIADFGISKFKDPHKSYLSVTQTGGTPNYMAPELFNGTRVDERCDIFSLGCILYEAVTRKVPFSDLPHDNFAPPLFQIIKTVAIDKKRPKIPEYCPHKLATLIRVCWSDNPKKRPSAAKVKEIIEGMMKEEMQHRKGDALKERQASGDAASNSGNSTGPSPQPDSQVSRRPSFFSGWMRGSQGRSPTSDIPDSPANAIPRPPRRPADPQPPPGWHDDAAPRGRSIQISDDTVGMTGVPPSQDRGVSVSGSSLDDSSLLDGRQWRGASENSQSSADTPGRDRVPSVGMQVPGVLPYAGHKGRAGRSHRNRNFILPVTDAHVNGRY